MRCIPKGAFEPWAFVAVVAVLLLMVTGDLVTVLEAQSPSSSSGIPNLSGYWDGGLIGRPRPGGQGSGRGGQGRGSAEGSAARPRVVLL
jgi:hypothetical protein